MTSGIATEQTEVTIERLGAQGDGVAETATGPVYVPFALPGERWRLLPDAPSVRLTASPQRAVPPCRHFGTCGGCIAQHMADDLYNAWKHGIVAQAFAHRGIEADIAPLRRIPAASRRRAFFGVTHTDNGVTLGFREEGQHRLVDLAECVILDPAIVAAMPALRELVGFILPRGADGARLIVTRLDHGLDVALETDAKLSADGLQHVARLAAAAGMLRLSIGNETIVPGAAPTLALGPAIVSPPPGIFLQAVPEAERLMTELILEAIPKVKSVADLFCGLGTFTFALARRARVIAADGDKRAIAALATAAKGAQGVKPITTMVRDLFREPLAVREMDGIDAAVFDPPRAGAQAQAERLAKSKVKTVVAVSCNPATLARDARILIDGGYKLERVTPIDQFVYSPHVEAVAIFRR
ncbi:MAG: class I SAM-dependent RNA methyltransferase [Hyphomicrobiaceae bacterium]|nr:class I SAM-dependent RNA methyltransferase [Hyphomicrobiaceae bacterium]